MGMSYYIHKGYKSVFHKLKRIIIWHGFNMALYLFIEEQFLLCVIRNYYVRKENRIV